MLWKLLLTTTLLLQFLSPTGHAVPLAPVIHGVHHDVAHPILLHREKRVAASTMAASIPAMIESGKTFVEILKDIKDVMLGPLTVALNALDDEIQKINWRIQGVTQDEREKVEKAVLLLAQVKIEIYDVRRGLITEADSTIRSSNRLIKIYARIQPNWSQDKIYRHVKYAVKEFTKILQASEKELEKAFDTYGNISKKLTSLHADLTSFAASVRKMAEGEDSRMEQWIDQTRETVYGGGAACIINVHVAAAVCPLYYIIAAATLETKIKQYRNKVKEMVDVATRASDTALEFASQAQVNQNFIKGERDIIEPWIKRVDVLQKGIYNDHSTPEDIVGEIEIQQDETINMLCDLNDISMQYILHENKGESFTGLLSILEVPPVHPKCSG